jgi:hypothetical protein
VPVGIRKHKQNEDFKSEGGVRMSKIILLAFICLTVCVSVPVFGATWYVDASVFGSGDGTSWATAFKTIQEGINAAADGHTVIVAEGMYVENVRFNGKNITLTSTDPLYPTVVANTIIDGNRAGSVVSFAGTENETCVLSGFTITNGSGTQTSGSDTEGGGIWGGTYYVRTHATIENNLIAGNSAYWYGGGLVYCDGTIHNNAICNNSCDHGSGGGLEGCDGTIQNNLITGNLAGLSGGALNCCDGTVQNNIIMGNSAIQYDGGGLLACNGIIQNNLIAQNSAGSSGGGISGGRGIIRSNTIAHNSAREKGGGVYWYGGDVINCIIWGNTAPTDPQVRWPNGYTGTVTFCCIEGYRPGKGNISKDPLFLGSDDYHLSAGSPCIDAGKTEDWMAGAFDLDGNARILDGNGDAGAVVDMGAYEYPGYIPNHPPVVSIASPVDGSAYDSGATIHFEGTADDPEDGLISNNLVWESAIDGPIGTGAEFDRTLSDGRHTITTFATDSEGATGSDSVTITVGKLPQLYVTVTTNKSAYKVREWVVINMAVKDGSANPVPGADVHVEVKTAKGKTYPYDGRTGTDGIFGFQHQTQNADTGTHSVTATASKPGYEPGSGSTTFNVYR